jgi:hypothetical protein
MKMWQKLVTSTKAMRPTYLKDEEMFQCLKPRTWLKGEMVNAYSELCVAELPYHKQEAIRILTTDFWTGIFSVTDLWKKTLHRNVSEFHTPQPACSNTGLQGDKMGPKKARLPKIH